MEQLEFLLSGREEIASYESADRLRKTQGSERYWQGFQSVVLAIPIHFRRQGSIGREASWSLYASHFTPFSGGESYMDGTRGTSLWLHKSSFKFRS